MIDRYKTKEMTRIWSDENRFSKWLDVELAVCRAWAADGAIPAEALRTIEERAGFDVARISEIEAVTHHDVIAFVTCVAERIGPEGRFVHLGLTSSDVIDTAAALLLSDALDVLIGAALDLRTVIARRAWQYRHLPTVGRSHGIHAEPTSFGLKFLGIVSEIERNIERLEQAREDIRVCKISGAVGNYADCPPHIEQRVAEELGLARDAVSTQIIQRDRHARVMDAVALYGAALERLAVEIRHLQRTEVLEATEPFGKRQKGSSAMPHKKNPINCERVAGMARLLRGYATAANENIALWHERDISHSSVERIIWPDAFHTAHNMTETMVRIMDGLVVNEHQVMRNLHRTRGLVFSGRVLLALVESGMSREDAYKRVQASAMACWESIVDDMGDMSFREHLEADPEVVRALGGSARIDELFSLEHYLRYVDEIFGRFDILKGAMP